jgi:hypothetical protein
VNIALNIYSIEHFYDFISSFKPIRGEKMFNSNEVKIGKIVIIGILNNERWFNPFHCGELFKQFAVITRNSAAFLE